MRKPHVLMIPSWYPTDRNPLEGCFFREQALALSKHGFKVGVLAPQIIYLGSISNRKNFNTGFRRYNDNEIRTYQKQYWNIFPKLHSLREARHLSIGGSMFKRYLDENGLPDILHAHVALYGGFLAKKISEKFRIPYIVTEHSTNFARKLYSERQIGTAAQVFRGASANICVSPELGRLLGEIYQGLHFNWLYIPNIVSDLFSPEKKEIDSPDRSFGLEKGLDYRILNVGSLTEKKGQRDLLVSFSEAFKGDMNVRLRIGGEGPLKEELSDLARRLDIASQVVFLGSLGRDQVANEMRQCDVFVLPSHYETFGVVLIEALACGKPVVATRSGGPESIVNTKNGILVHPGDIHALACAMKEARLRRKDYDPLLISRECRETYGEESVVGRLSEVYRSILNE
ncbi:MAG: glycosyltransferase [Synergistota bacterium]|nr:glycosyltransferase [Synergistota bacterium]